MLVGALWYIHGVRVPSRPRCSPVCFVLLARPIHTPFYHYMTFFSEASLLVHPFVFEGVRGVLNVYLGTFKFAEVLA